MVEKNNWMTDDKIKIASMHINQSSTTPAEFVTLMKDWFTEGVNNSVPLEVSWPDKARLVKITCAKDCDTLLPMFLDDELSVPSQVVIQA